MNAATIIGNTLRWVLIGVAAALVSACSNSEKGSADSGAKAGSGTGTSGSAATEVSIYTMQLKPMYTKYMEDVFAGFEKAHPGVKVRWIDAPADGYETKLLSMISSQQAPDVQNLPIEHMHNLQSRGLLLELDDRLTSEQKSVYLDKILQKGCTVGGHLYSVPWYLTAQIMMYNRDYFRAAGLDAEKPPTNDEELFAAARQIKQKTGKFGFLMTFTEEGQLKNILASAGIPLVSADKKRATFYTPKAVALLTSYKQLFDEGVIPRESLTANHRRAIELYKRGETTFLISGPNFLLDLDKDSPEVYKATGIARGFPIRDTGEYDITMQNLAVYAKSAHPKEAIDLALWVTNAENQLAFSKIVTIFPSAKDALKDPYFTQPGERPEDKARNLTVKMLENGTVMLPELPHLPELNRVMEDTTRDVLTKGVDPATALAAAEKKWTEILQK